MAGVRAMTETQLFSRSCRWNKRMGVNEQMEERLQKILASAGIASRREAEKIIVAGRVRVNGKIVTELGAKADIFKDRISVDGKRVVAEEKAYYIFYKPRGVVTTMKDPQNRRSIGDFVRDIPEHVFPVGRLDYNTEGLLLLTNDGALAQSLMHPKNEIAKTYIVKVPGIVSQDKLDQLKLGILLEDGKTAPAVVNLRDYNYERNFTVFDISIHEGRNRQIRRMCDAIGFPVRDLRRIKIGPLELKDVARGKSRPLTDSELKKLMQAAGQC